MQLLWRMSPETIYGASFPERAGGSGGGAEGISQRCRTAIKIKKPGWKGSRRSGARDRVARGTGSPGSSPRGRRWREGLRASTARGPELLQHAAPLLALIHPLGGRPPPFPGRPAPALRQQGSPSPARPARPPGNADLRTADRPAAGASAVTPEQQRGPGPGGCSQSQQEAERRAPGRWAQTGSLRSRGRPPMVPIRVPNTAAGISRPLRIDVMESVACGVGGTDSGRKVALTRARGHGHHGSAGWAWVHAGRPRLCLQTPWLCAPLRVCVWVGVRREGVQAGGREGGRAGGRAAQPAGHGGGACISLEPDFSSSFPGRLWSSDSVHGAPLAGGPRAARACPTPTGSDPGAPKSPPSPCQ